MDNVRRILKNSGFQGMAFGSKALVMILVSILIARLAGSETLGQFVVLITLASLLASISGFGLPELLTRRIACNRNDETYINMLIGTALMIVGILSILAILILLVVGIVMGYVSPELIRALIFTGIALALEMVVTVIMTSFIGTETMGWSSTTTIAMESSFLVMASLVIKKNPQIDWLMAAYLLSRVAALGIVVQFYYSQFNKICLDLIQVSPMALVKESFPFAVNGALSMVYVRLDVIILAAMSGNYLVGIYEVATSLTMRANILARTVKVATFPFISFQYSKDKRTVRLYTAETIHYLLIPGFLIAGVLWIFGENIIQFLYGEGFSEAGLAIKSLALIIPLRFIDNSLATALTASNRQNKRSIAIAIAASMNVFLTIVLVSSFHLMGAVYATILTEVVLFGAFVWYLREEILEMISWSVFTTPSLGILSAFLVLTLFKSMSFWLLGVIFVTFYGLTVVILDRSSAKLLYSTIIRRK